MFRNLSNPATMGTTVNVILSRDQILCRLVVVRFAGVSTESSGLFLVDEYR
jgi:hypothetical protein